MNETGTSHTLLITDPKSSRRVILNGLKYTIGRDIKNDIQLHSKFVSRQHAVLLRVPGSIPGSYLYRVIDGDLSGKPSVNGVIVNGNTRISSHELSHGDSITLAPDAQLTYLIDISISEISKMAKPSSQTAKSNDDSDTLFNEVTKIR
jgi:pSer/pThr/pTyr-binding forkhead associated (FHA) protein